MKEKVEKDENKLVAITAKILNDMKRKSAYMGLADIPSKRNSVLNNQQEPTFAHRPIDAYEERKSTYLGLADIPSKKNLVLNNQQEPTFANRPIDAYEERKSIGLFLPPKPQRKSMLKQDNEPINMMRPIDPYEERKSMYVEARQPQVPQTRKSVWKGQEQMAESILIPGKPIEPSMEKRSIFESQHTLGPVQRKSVWKGQESMAQPPKQVSPTEIIQVRKSIWKAAEDAVNEKNKPSPDKKVSFSQSPPIRGFDSASDENSNKTEEEVDEEAGEFLQHVQLTGCSGSITVIKIVKETDLAVGFSTGELALYSMADDFKLKFKAKEHLGSISALESGNLTIEEGGTGFRNMDVIMTGGNETDKTVVVWDASTFQPLKRLNGHQHMVTSIVDIGDSATFVTSSMDGQIAFWNMRSAEPECIQIVEDLRFPIITMKFDFDDGILTAGTIDGQIGMWQLLIEDDVYAGCSLLRIVEMQGHVIEILRSSCLPRALITLESDFCVREYDLVTGKLTKTVRSDKPLIDVFLVEKVGAKKVMLFTVDNASNLHRVKDWGKAPARMTLGRTREADVSIKRYIGYNPRSQIFIRGQDLLLITCDQSNQKLEINKLNISD